MKVRIYEHRNNISGFGCQVILVFHHPLELRRFSWTMVFTPRTLTNWRLEKACSGLSYEASKLRGHHHIEGYEVMDIDV